MCEQCQIEATSYRSGASPAILSKLLGRYACEHTSSCKCQKCERYRDQNPFADTGLFLSQCEIK